MATWLLIFFPALLWFNAHVIVMNPFHANQHRLGLLLHMLASMVGLTTDIKRI